MSVLSSFMPANYDHMKPKVESSIEAEEHTYRNKLIIPNKVNMKDINNIDQAIQDAKNLTFKLLKISKQTHVPKEYNSTSMDLFTTAIGQYDVRETEGIKNNPEVVKYSEDFGGNGTDSMPWCSAFLNWCALTAGYEYTNKLNARSWATIGQEVSEDDYQLGDVVVLWRNSRSSWQGHCALFVRQTEDSVYLLGGNQSDKVTISKYSKNRVLTVRRLSKSTSK